MLVIHRGKEILNIDNRLMKLINITDRLLKRDDKFNILIQILIENKLDR